MKSKVTLLVMLAALITASLMALQVPADFPGNRGPIMDVLRQQVVRSPDAALTQMLNHQTDIWPSSSAPMYSTDVLNGANGLVRASDIETLREAGMLATQDLGFHVGYIAWNIRDTATVNTIRTTYRGLSAVSYWPLHDVEFREALIRSYDQLRIIPLIYGYAVTPVRSLVPPAQSKYYNAAVPSHPFNQGNPFTSPTTEKSTCGILKKAGYTFVDAGTIGVVDDADYWKMPNGDPLPYMEIWTPLETDAPTSWMHGHEFLADLATVGLAATTANGDHGFVALGRDFNEYLNDVFGTDSAPGGQFDAYMCYHEFGRLPSQLYSLCHSSQDSYFSGFPSGPWGLSNGPGANDPDLDTLCETVKYSLNPDVIEVAAKEIQSMLYTTDKTIYPNADNFALAYMTLYSKTYVNVFTNDLLGAVRSLGYGSDNMWTYLNLHWKSGGTYERLEDVDSDGDLESVMVYINGLPPDSLNPTYATTQYEWNIIKPNLDGLTAVNPYNHYDIPWIASDWDITEVGGGMEVNYTLRDDVYWADGYKYDAYAVEFNWEFFRDWSTPNYNEGADVLTDVSVADATHCTVIASEAGLDLFYDYSGGAAVLPPQIWNRTWANSAEVLTYHPEDHAYGSDMAPGYAVGPWAEPGDPAPKVATNLFGTGPWIYQFYDELNDWDDEHANRNYFMTQAEIQNLLVEMFHESGDVNRDGYVDGDDLYLYSMAFGYFQGEDNYDPDADLNGDGVVDAEDGDPIGYHIGDRRTYPDLSGGSAGSSSDCVEQRSFCLKSQGAQESSPFAGTTIYVDPPNVMNETLQPPSTFTVDTNIFNVSNLRTWQVKMSWDTTILSPIAYTQGDFLKRNTWNGKPYDHKASTLTVDHPVRAYDTNLDSYASFRYSEADANFTVLDFGHNFPSGCHEPADEQSEIEQVDFYLRYSANASAAGDKYRIVYYNPLHGATTPVVLAPWTSVAVPLETYVWENVTEPDNDVWDWFDVSAIEFAVETDSVGGDPDALLREYEAWMVVTYKRQTQTNLRANPAQGWVLFSELTLGHQYPGVTGSGRLATLEFQVLAYGRSVLNITDQHPPTKLMAQSGGKITHTTENGYFSNMIPGDIMGDTPGSAPDGDVDMYDLGEFADAYGSHEGEPEYNELADLIGDTPGSAPDGDVDMYDLGVFADNYGRHI